MAGMDDMDAILDQALDDLENVDAATTVQADSSEAFPQKTGLANAPKSPPSVQSASSSNNKNAAAAADEIADPKEFLKYLIESDEVENDEDRNAKLDEFMKQIQTKLQAETVEDDDDDEATNQDDNVAATLASILEQMTTMDQDDPLLREGGADFNPDDVVDGMMEQLLSKDLMYEPMKQVADRYPAWLEANQESLSAEDLEKYTKQFECFKNLVHQYENDAGNMESLMHLMQEVQEYGQPPQDIINEIAPGLELDDDGLPKMNPLEALGNVGDGDCPVM